MEARRGRTVVARGSAVARRGSETRVVARFTKAAKRRLRGARTLTLRVGVRTPDGAATRTVRLR